MRNALLSPASRYPQVCRALLRILAPVLPHRWIVCEMVSRCGGTFRRNFRLGNGMKVTGFLGDLVCYQIEAHGWYEPEMVEAVRRVLTRDTIFFDVGAHIGQYTLMAAPLCCSVHSFEANHATALALRGNVHDNGLENVEVNEMAVSDKEGTTTFHESSGHNPGSSSLYGEGKPVTVTTKTLDSYCDGLGSHPVVLKIDVEGAELNVLRGAEHLLSRPSVTIFAEMIESLQSRAGSSTKEVIQFLQQRGYSVRWFDEKNITASVPVTAPVSQ